MQFTYDCQTTGWVSIGFDANPVIHTSTDMYVSWIQSSGTGVVYDGYSNAQRQPVLDARADAVVTNASLVNGRLHLTFVRPVLSSDPRDRNLTGLAWLGWAYHESARPDALTDTLPMHTHQGTVQVNWDTGEIDNVDAFFPSTYYILAWLNLFSVIAIVRMIRYAVKPDSEHPRGFYRGSQFQPWLASRVPYFHVSKNDALFVLLVLAMNAACVVVGVYTGFNQAQIWGYLCAANSFLVAIPATRNSVLLWLSALPIDQTIRYHRWMGRLVLLEAIVHVACLIDRASFTWTRANQYGLGAAIALVWIGATSLEWIRRHAFNTFFYAHHVFFAFYVLASLHSDMFFVYACAAAVVYALDRLVRLFRGLYPRAILAVEALTHEVVKIQFAKRAGTRHEPGQFVFLNFPGINLLEWHPFTLVDAPNETAHTVYVKTLGDHTRRLVQHVAGAKWVRMDGPYGKWSLTPTGYSHVLFVCGGVGITPCLAFIRSVYGATSPPTNIRHLRHLRHLYLVWCCPTEDEACWVNRELLDALQHSTESGYPAFRLYVFITGQTTVRNPTYYTGRPDMDQVFDTMENYIVDDPARACVRVCGPQSLSQCVWDTCSRRSRQYDFKQEIFEF